MIKSRDEIITAISARFGDEPTDEDIKLLEDVTDTISDFEKKTKDSTDWKQKYEENDKEWKKKYTDRFLNKDVKDEPTEDDNDESKPLTYNDLFKFE